MSKFFVGFEKYHAGAALHGILDHCSRRKLPENADPARAHLNVFGGNFDPASFRTNRTNGVALVEIVVTASREWEGFGGKAEGWNAFRDHAKEYFEDLFGGQATAEAEHWDEITPHVHLLISPLALETSARAMIGGPKYRLEDIQADFERKVGMAHGLRYQKGLRASHVKLSEFYKAMDEGFPENGWRTIDKAAYDRLAELAALGQSAADAMAQRLRQIDRPTLRVALDLPQINDQIEIIKAVRHRFPGVGHAGAINRVWMAATKLGLLTPQHYDFDEIEAERCTLG